MLFVVLPCAEASPAALVGPARATMEGRGVFEVVQREHESTGLRRTWSDASTWIRLSPAERCEKLTALVPRPRTNAVPHHGYGHRSGQEAYTTTSRFC